MNYSRANDEDWKDSPADWLFGSLVFARAIGLVLKEDNVGVVVDLKGDMLELTPYENNKKVIVYHNEKQTIIVEADERTDLKEGDIVHMIDEDLISN